MVSRRELLQGAALALLAASRAARAAAVPGATLSDARLPFVSRLCEIVVPATETPGGAAVGAGQFVLLAIDHQISGLNPAALTLVHTHLDALARRPFLDLDAKRQLELLTDLDRRAFDAPHGDAMAPAGIPSPEQAWRALKPAIVAGYYTSEAGASRELVYEPVPESTRTNFTMTADYRARSNEGFGGDL